jgi:hypothetical protein
VLLEVLLHVARECFKQYKIYDFSYDKKKQTIGARPNVPHLMNEKEKKEKKRKTKDKKRKIKRKF